MRKLIIIASLLVVLIAGYTGFWFYQARQVRLYVEQKLASLSESSPFGQGMVIAYSDLRVGGYPLAPTVMMTAPKAVISTGPSKLQFSSDILEIRRSLLPPYVYKINPGLSITSSFEDGENPPFTSIIRYKTSPTAEFSFNEKRKTGYVNYEDSGIDIVDDSGQVVSSAAKMLFSITSTEAENEKLRIQLKSSVKDSSYADVKPSNELPYGTAIRELWKNAGLGKTNGSVSINILAPNDLKKISGIPEVIIDIKEFNFSTEAFAINTQGNVESVASDLFPFGKMTVKLVNYKKLVEFLVHVTEITQQESLRQGAIAPENSFIPADSAGQTQLIESLNNFLRGIATPPDADSADVTIIFNRDKGGSFYIGSLTAPEVIMLYQKLFVKEAEKNTPPPIAPAPDFVAPPAIN